ncbi:MAG: glycerol-3-phosphate 1-O-acyltransferase PlsY [Deltaproteobacteria bacterium]|nr:glycerol-3-phosphate 1-O-acyltransferase PlsY [Deltaproteobacteria bacterium]
MYGALPVVPVLVTAYLLGSVPFGLLLGKLAGVDVRKAGSGNIGATNVLRTCGTGWGIAAFVLDFLKGYGPVMICMHFSGGGTLAAVSAAVLAVLGHNFPVWLRFRGGKGVATSAGGALALVPLPLAAGGIAFLIMVFITRYVSLGSMTGATVMAVTQVLVASAPFSMPELPKTIMVLVMFLMVMARHRANMSRLLRGEESKIGKRKENMPNTGGQKNR